LEESTNSSNSEKDHAQPAQIAGKNICIKCKNEIAVDASLCSFCGSNQNRSISIIKNVAKGIGFIVIFLTLILHAVSLWPSITTTFFPEVGIEVLAFQSNSRLIFTSTGNHEVFVSHVHYEATDREPYMNAFTEILSNLRKEPVEKQQLKLDYEGALFDTNLDVGLSLKPGEVKTRNYKKATEEIRTFVRNLPKNEWNRLVFLAAGNQRSQCMRPIFFSPKDRRFIQGLRNDAFNTFPVKGFIQVFSPRLKKNVEIPFEVVGTIAIKNNDECLRIIKKLADFETSPFSVPPEGSVPLKVP
jgi:ribosomal protein L40E